MVTSAFFYLLAAISEIAGCFAFWHWYRNHGSVWIPLPCVHLILKRSSSHQGRQDSAGIMLAVQFAFESDSQMEKQLKDHGRLAFQEARRDPETNQQKAEIEKLRAKVGELMMERDYLKNVLDT